MVTYLIFRYRLDPGLLSANISYLMQLESFFKIGHACTIPKGVESLEWNRIVLSLQSYYYGMIRIGCGEMGDYFATEADTMIDIVRLT